MILLSFWCSLMFGLWSDEAAPQSQAWHLLTVEALSFLALVQTSYYFNNLYDLRRLRPRRKEVLRVGGSLAAAGFLFVLLHASLPAPALDPRVFILALGLTAASSKLVRVTLEKTWPAEAVRQKILIVGTGSLALAVERELARRSDLAARVAGMVGSALHVPGSASMPLPREVLGTYEDLEATAADHGVSRIIIALEDWRGTLPTRQLMKLRVSGVAVEDAHTLLAALTGRIWLEAIRPSWLMLFVFSGGFRRSRWTALIKRASDLFFGVLGLLLTAPVLLAAAMAIKLGSRGPVVYRQQRIGLRGKPFDLLKLRSMRMDAESDGQERWASQNDPRITPVGRYLRKFRIDEFPQFLNVIRGDMSFVGPRPERPGFVRELGEQFPFYELRHTVRPGITGWAQVRYPYSATPADAIRKLEYDLFYLKHMSLPFDCSIVFRTLGTVLLGRGSR